MADSEKKYVPPDPPLGFYFRVSLPENVFMGQTESELSFQSVSGLTKEVVTESYREGGQLYEYALPVKFQYPDLVLKRGLWIPTPGYGLDAWQSWFDVMMQSFQEYPANIQISLLRANGDPAMTWKVIRAWPKKWTIADFNAEQSQVVIETLEMHYDSFEILK